MSQKLYKLREDQLKVYIESQEFEEFIGLLNEIKKNEELISEEPRICVDCWQVYVITDQDIHQDHKITNTFQEMEDASKQTFLKFSKLKKKASKYQVTLLNVAQSIISKVNQQNINKFLSQKSQIQNQFNKEKLNFDEFPSQKQKQNKTVRFCEDLQDNQNLNLANIRVGSKRKHEQQQNESNNSKKKMKRGENEEELIQNRKKDKNEKSDQSIQADIEQKSQQQNTQSQSTQTSRESKASSQDIEQPEKFDFQDLLQKQIFEEYMNDFKKIISSKLQNLDQKIDENNKIVENFDKLIKEINLKDNFSQIKKLDIINIDEQKNDEIEEIQIFGNNSSSQPSAQNQNFIIQNNHRLQNENEFGNLEKNVDSFKKLINKKDKIVSDLEEVQIIEAQNISDNQIPTDNINQDGSHKQQEQQNQIYQLIFNLIHQLIMNQKMEMLQEQLRQKANQKMIDSSKAAMMLEYKQSNDSQLDCSQGQLQLYQRQNESIRQSSDTVSEQLEMVREAIQSNQFQNIFNESELSSMFFNYQNFQNQDSQILQRNEYSIFEYFDFSQKQGLFKF